MGIAAMNAESNLEFVRTVCAGLTPAGIEVVPHAHESAFVPSRNLILIARRFLATDKPVAIGILLHEVGHSLVTRYDRFAMPKAVSAPLWKAALNAVEETRVHSFLQRRLPGVRPYLEALFAMDEPPPPERFESELLVFLSAVATCDRYVNLPFLEHFKLAATAFHRTSGSRARYAATLPPANLMPLPNLEDRYERDVVPLLRNTNAGTDDRVEAEIMCGAAAAHRIFLVEIWPEMQALAARDETNLARVLQDDQALHATAQRRCKASAAADLAKVILRKWAATHDGATADLDVASIPIDDVDKRVRELGRWLLDQYLEQRNREQMLKGASHDRAAPVDVSGSEGDREAAGDPDYIAVAEALRAVVPRRRKQHVSGYRSGLGLDLDRVMRATATGRDTDRIWMRRTREHPTLAAMLLVDLSGSMRGPKVEGAITATKSLSRALATIRGVSWSVFGFQDKTIPFVQFGDRADHAVMSRIDAMRQEVAGTRPGGNNRAAFNDDGPCLLEAAAILDDRPECDRLLIVISDGRPSGERSGASELRAAIAALQAKPNLTLVGLGLGASTEHVREFYPMSRANISPRELATAIGNLLAQRLGLVL